MSDIALPEKGKWVRVTERKPNQVTKIHEGPVYMTTGGGDFYAPKTISLGADSWRYTVTLNKEEGHGLPTWEYISPPEPKAEDSVWVIPYDDDKVILWQRQSDRASRLDHRWFSAGVATGLPWSSIIDRERGYLLEVKRD